MVAVLVWSLDRCLCFLVLWSLLVLLCSSFGAPALFQAAPGAVLLWSGYCPWSVYLSMVTTGALVVSVVAAHASVVAFGRRWYFSRSFSHEHVGLHLFFLFVHAKFVDIGYSQRSNGCAVSRKVAVVVMHGVACPFVRLQVLVLVYAANLLQLIGPCLPAGPPQLPVLAVYDHTRF